MNKTNNIIIISAVALLWAVSTCQAQASEFFTESATSTPAVIAPVQDASSTTPLATVSVHIRYQDVLVFEGQAPIPQGPSVPIQDNKGKSYNVNATSVLAVLNALDNSSTLFAISDLAYFDSFGSFLINCISIAKTDADACFNWQYVVNGTYPFVGVDQYLLHAGDDVYLYFGSQHRVVIDNATIPAGQVFLVSAQNYQYTTNQWTLLAIVTVGITQPNPNDQFSPLVIASSTVDSLGKATFTLLTPGQYNVGIAQDFYFPSTPLTIIAQASSTTGLPLASANASSTASQLPPASSAGGATGASVPPPAHFLIDVPKAIQFLANNKNTNGSYGSAPLYSDWVAIALGAYSGANDARESLKAYLSADPPPGNSLTDYERRAMALMALGIDPYAGTATNYIQKILSSFDGNQFGDAGLVNDDIFALIPLIKAGVNQHDPAIQKTTAFILAQQHALGSWVGGVDMTAAAVQALTLVSSQDGVSPALQKARAYLKGQQDSTGGFNQNLFSTTWAMQAIGALGEDSASWQNASKTGDDYLYANQKQDGSLGLPQDDANNRIWLTAYAIPAALKKPWGQILGNFVAPSSSSSLPQISVPTNSLPVSPYASSTLPIAPLVAPPVASQESLLGQQTSPTVQTSTVSPSVQRFVVQPPTFPKAQTSGAIKILPSATPLPENEPSLHNELNKSNGTEAPHRLSTVNPFVASLQTSSLAPYAKTVFIGALILAFVIGIYLFVIYH